MEKVIITGATSFIATNLIKEIEKENFIYAIIRKNSTKKDKLKNFKNIKIIELNMENLNELDNFIKEKCDTFFHFAWDGTRGTERENEEKQNNNIKNSIKALKIAKDLGCKTFFTAGSQAEYGIQENKIDENSITKPITKYGKAKLEFYNYAKKFCKENNIRLFEPRIFSIYGEGDYENTLIMSTIKKMKNNETVELSECSQIWNYLYIKDAVKALVLINKSNSKGEIFNIGSNDTRELKSFILELKEILKSKSKLEFGAIKSNTKSQNLNPNIQKLLDLGWKEEYTFEKGIRELITEE